MCDPEAPGSGGTPSRPAREPWQRPETDVPNLAHIASGVGTTIGAAVDVADGLSDALRRTGNWMGRRPWIPWSVASVFGSSSVDVGRIRHLTRLGRSWDWISEHLGTGPRLARLDQGTLAVGLVNAALGGPQEVGDAAGILSEFHPGNAAIGTAFGGTMAVIGLAHAITAGEIGALDRFQQNVAEGGQGAILMGYNLTGQALTDLVSGDGCGPNSYCTRVGGKGKWWDAPGLLYVGRFWGDVLWSVFGDRAPRTSTLPPGSGVPRTHGPGMNH
jgi:hypothetical protein